MLPVSRCNLWKVAFAHRINRSCFICKGEAAAQGFNNTATDFRRCNRANFLSVIGLPHSLVFTLINLAVSAFALTSLDSVARVGRLSFQEFFLDEGVTEENMTPFQKVVTNKYFATIITLVLSFLFAKSWLCRNSLSFTNQLLSFLLLVCSILEENKTSGLMLWVPYVLS